MLKNIEIIETIKQNIAFFECFDEVYLFGSTISNNVPSDIDLLIIYSKHLTRNEVDSLHEKIYSLLEIPLDITFLTFIEETEVDFLKKLDNKYIRIK